MKKFRLIGLFEGNKWMPLVAVARIDPTIDGMVGFALEWTPLDHFDSAVNMKEKPAAIIQHYATTALAVFTWGQVVNAYRLALDVAFREAGPQIQKKDGKNVVSIEEWRDGAWATLGPLDMPVLHHAPPHPEKPSLKGSSPGPMVLAAAALDERFRSRKKA